jgi:hypothetical protein
VDDGLGDIHPTKRIVILLIDLPLLEEGLVDDTLVGGGGTKEGDIEEGVYGANLVTIVWGISILVKPDIVVVDTGGNLGGYDEHSHLLSITPTIIQCLLMLVTIVSEAKPVIGEIKVSVLSVA